MRINKDLKLLVLLEAAIVCSTLGYPLASYLDCTTKAYLPGVGFVYLSMIGASGQSVFFQAHE
jgi:hypothetical protein